LFVQDLKKIYMSKELGKLTFWEKAGYGCGDLASVLFWQTIMVYLLFFYTDVFGLTAAAAGIMFFVSRILDAFFDVVIGMTADRTTSRWGKFRPYILWGAVPLAVSAVLTFTTPGFGETGKLIYAYITFILFMFLYSTVNIPYTSLLGVISNDPNDRTSASSFKFTGAYIAGFLVSATALPFATYFGHGNEAKGWSITMIIFAITAVIFFLITFLFTRERIKPMIKEKTSIDLDLGILVSNGPWLMLFLTTILFILFVCIRLSVTAHYFKYYVGVQEFSFFGHTYKYGFEVLASAFNTLGQGLSLVGVLLVPWFAKILGRKKAVIILLFTAIICTGAFYFFKPENLFLIFFFQALGSITGGPVSALLWVLYADTADYAEWKTGIRATGLVFSASIMSNKLGWAIGSMIAGLILFKTGFVANIAQNIEVLSGLKSMMSIIPVAAGIFALILLFFYNLNESLMKRIKEDLETRRALPAKELPKLPGLFSFNGRATRSMFWGMSIVAGLPLYLVYYTFMLILSSFPESFWKYLFLTILIAFALILIWISLVINVKRWHDLSYSGYMIFIGLVPIVGSIISIVMLGFFKGKNEENKYGKDLMVIWQNTNAIS
jgi:glycoside/pentoside/hexuronide:cation symporter, GPH family